MVRNKAIFAGTSHTIGIGLELEFSKRFQDDYYLTNVCTKIPPVGENDNEQEVYTEEDLNNQKKYRWSKVLCNKLNLEEVNINTLHGNPAGIQLPNRSAIFCVLDLVNRKKEKSIVKLISQTKYIILELGYIRWFEPELHGSKDGNKWPSTPAEVQNFIERTDIPVQDKQRAIEWVSKVDPESIYRYTLENIKELQTTFPEVQVIILAWGAYSTAIDVAREMEMEHLFVKRTDVYRNIKEAYRIEDFLRDNNLFICDNVLAYTPKYKDKWLYLDKHATSEGHKLVAEMVIKHLQNG